jgi:hypothetical protein
VPYIRYIRLPETYAYTREIRIRKRFYIQRESKKSVCNVCADTGAI